MPLAEYAEMAARIGCTFISLNYGGAANRLDERDARTLRESVSLRHELAAAVAAQDLRIELVEGFAITPELSVEKYASDLDAVAKLGARSICAVSLDKELARTNDQFAALAAMGQSRGLAVTTEVGAGVIRNFDVACRAWEQVAHQNFSLLIDTMHFFRRGANVEDLAAIPTETIGHVQLCDVPMPSQMQDYLEEALFERRAPGDGDLPLSDFLARVPTGVPIGLEIPVRSARDAGLTAESVLRSSLLAVEAMLQV